MYVVIFKTYPQSKWKVLRDVFETGGQAEHQADRMIVAGAYRAVARRLLTN